MPAVTVVICTYNRADLLARALDSLCRQDASPDLFEILIVDNASTDRTPDVAEQYMRHHPNVRYCHESKQGLSHARNRGWCEAKGAYVAYVDDECEMPPSWISQALAIIESRAPAIFGGPYYPRYSDPKPPWFKDAYGSDVKEDNTPRALGSNEYVSGGNMFVRRSLLEAQGGFHPALGMQGGQLGYGEETALQMAVRQAGSTEEVFYHPALKVHHLVRPEKMNLLWNIRQHFVGGRYSIRVLRTSEAGDTLDPITARREAVLTVLRLLRGIADGLWRRDRSKYPFPQNFVFERMLPEIGRLGEAWERLRSARRRR